MSSEISTTLRPFVSHQAVSVLLVIENSCAMNVDWPNVRDRYVRTMIETLKAANATIPMDLMVLPTLSQNIEHSSSASGLQKYNDLRDFNFNHNPDNRIHASHIHQAIDYLMSSDFGKHSSTVRHIFIVAATSPSDSFSSQAGVEGEPKSQWQLLAQRLTEAHIYHHLIANTSQDMAPLMNLFEETLRLQGNVENKVQVTWQAQNAPVYTVRLASRTQAQISATNASRRPQSRSVKGKEVATRPSLCHEPSHSEASATTTLASLSVTEPRVSEGPSLVSQLQQMHGLVKKKIHIVPPPRQPFFREERVGDDTKSGTSPSCQPRLPETISEGGRVQTQFKIDRSTRIRDRPSKKSRASKKLSTHSHPMRLEDDESQPATCQAKFKLQCDTRMLANRDEPQTSLHPESISDYVSPTSVHLVSPLSPSVTDSLGSVTLGTGAFIPNHDILTTRSLSKRQTFQLVVPPPPTQISSDSIREKPQFSALYNDSRAESELAYLDLPGPASEHVPLVPPDLSQFTTDEELIKSTQSIMMKMTPDYTSMFQRYGKVELPVPPQPSRRRASTISTLPSSVSTVHDEAPNVGNISLVSSPPTPPVITIPAVASAEKLPEQGDGHSADDRYWHDMNLLFGPNHPAPADVEGLPSYALDVSDLPSFDSTISLDMTLPYQSMPLPSFQPLGTFDLGSIDEIPPSYTPLTTTSFDPLLMFGFGSERLMPFDTLQSQLPPAPSYPFSLLSNDELNRSSDIAHHSFLTNWTP